MLLFYSATARHEQDTKCLRMASRNMDICPGVFFVPLNRMVDIGIITNSCYKEIIYVFLNRLTFS